MSLMLSERRGAVAILTLNNPEKYNALGGSILAEFSAAFDSVAADPAIRSILVTGAGKGFCGGAQLGTPTFDSGAGVAELIRGALNPLIEKVRACPIPVVVAVNGPAAGAGVGLALMGDIVIAARSARFVLSFVKLGAALDGGTSLLVQRAVGAPRARALALLGEPLSADMAAEWGLIWKAVDDTDLMPQALALAHKLADGPPVANGLIKAQIEGAPGETLAQALEDEAVAQSKAFATRDLKEGAAAFMERRAPQFAGR